MTDISNLSDCMLFRPLSVPVPTIKNPGIEILEYVVVRKKTVQARLSARVTLVPNMDMNAFKCSAVIDWLKLRIVLRIPTQSRWVHSALPDDVKVRGCWVSKPLDTSSNVGCAFDLTFQEPSREVVVNALRQIGDVYGLSSEPELGAIEFSIDFTPWTHLDSERHLLVAILARHLRPDPLLWNTHRGKPRCTWGGPNETQFLFPHSRDPEVDQVMMPLDPDLDHGTYADATLYVGPRDGDVMFRIMEKLIDRQNRAAGTRLLLPQQKRRARIEVTIRGQELEKVGLRRLSDLAEFRFTRLQGRYFRFMLPTFPAGEPASSLERNIQVWREKRRRSKFALTGVIGLELHDRAWASVGRTARRRTKGLERRGRVARRRAVGVNGTFIAYSALNRRIQTALRHLGESWNT